MSSKYDLYWQENLNRVKQLIEEAYKNGTSDEVDVHDIQGYGDRNSWYGIVEVSTEGVRKGEMAHAKSLGNVIFQSDLLAPYGKSKFRAVISTNQKLRVERLGEEEKLISFPVQFKEKSQVSPFLENKNIDRRKKQLANILTEIPWETWESIVRQEPEWYNMEPFIDHFGYGPFATLMVATGLNNYQLKGKAEKVYWPNIRKFLKESPAPRSITELYSILEPFYQKERLNTKKIGRLRYFLGSPLAHELWESLPRKISKELSDIWRRLAKTMGQKPEDKTISFAMKCLGISLLMVKEYGLDFSQIPIPVDSRAVKFTRRTRIYLDETDEKIRVVWNEILSLLQSKNSSLTMVHLDSLVWQIASMDDIQLERYFKSLGISQVGENLSNFLREKTITTQSKKEENMSGSQKKTLILIPCSGSKRKGSTVTYDPKSAIFDHLTSSSREHLLRLRRKLFGHFSMKMGQDVGYPDEDEIEYMQAYSRYTGQIYRQISPLSWDKLKRTPHLDLVIVSALYGLVRYDEPIRYYDKMMKDRVEGQLLKTWWRNNNLGEILREYINKNNISEVHVVLSNDYKEALSNCFRDTDEVRYVSYDFSKYKSGSNAYRGRWINEFIRNF